MGNDGKRKLGLKWKDDKASCDTTAEYLEMKPVPPGWMHCIQQVAAIDETSAIDKLLIGTRSGNDIEPLEDTPSPAADQNYTWKGECHLHEGQIFSIKFMGCGATDKISAVVRGWKQKVQ